VPVVHAVCCISVSVPEDSQEKQEHVDEVEVELQRTHD
jgi:hypothetical protein